MEINAIQAALAQPDLAARISGIKALRDYDADLAVPLLVSRMRDPEFLVRSLVAMGLRHQKNAESFAALLEMLTLDRDTNVQAEAANSLSFFGAVSVPHLVKAFYQSDNWLVRRSILACLTELNVTAELFEVCLQALEDEDLTVQETAIDAMKTLKDSEKHSEVLQQLLQLVESASWRIRIRVAYALKSFTEPQAQAAIQALQRDLDHRVVGAALEGLI